MNNAHEQKLEHIISRMQNDRSVDAPVDALKYAKNLFKVQAAEPSLLTRVIAVLKAELEPNRAVFGERSAPGGTARQMLFDAGVNAVDLRVTVSEDGFDVRGQILGEGFDGGSVSFAGLETSIDEIGGFTFANIPAGKYSLTVRGESSDITVEEFILS